jgi:tRNA pseudouridine55 synthase
MDGVLVIDKPVGPTSHDVVARVRRAIGERRVGHTGTLDPAASGVLPLVVGRATRLARFLSIGGKSYEASIRLGISTDTGDAQGTAVGALFQHALPSSDAINEALDPFRGTFLQQPPAYSAKKIDGKRSHTLARARARRTSDLQAASATEEVHLPAPARVTTYRLDIVDTLADVVTLSLDCSAGFYVRSLAHDLGERLGTGAHLIALRRTRSGDFSLRDTLLLDVVERDREAAIAGLVPLSAVLLELSSVVLTAEGARHACHGRDLAAGDLASSLPAALGSWIRLLGQDGDLLGIARPAVSPGVLHPSVVLV